MWKVLLAGLVLTTPAFAQAGLAIATRNFIDTAERCVLDVRDRGLKYETSINCRQLKDASLKYIEPGGDLTTTDPSLALLAERARSMAWMARALSAGAPPYLW